MADLWNPERQHRLKFDGSFDAICLLCFATIANTKAESDLADFERDHSCGSQSLWSCLQRPPEHHF
jgi:hypothetical protein